MDELSLELFIRILSRLDAKDLIRSRAVNRMWRQVIDEYVLLELTLCNDRVVGYPPRRIFQAHNRTYSDPKRTILHLDKKWYSLPWYARCKPLPGYERNVDLEKIQFLFRNARTLTLFERDFDPEPMGEFISE